MTVLADCFYNLDEMYSYIETYAAQNDLRQTLAALAFAKAKHAGQTRKGKEKIPYIYHPLLVTGHAIALGIGDDNMLSAALLHDVVEDCDVSLDELPVNDATKLAVMLVTKTDCYYRSGCMGAAEYYSALSENDIAIMVKLLDRCNNVAGMAAAFSKEKMMSYVNDTEVWIYPLFEKARTSWPKYEHPIFLLEYQMKSTIESLKRVL